MLGTHRCGPARRRKQAFKRRNKYIGMASLLRQPFALIFIMGLAISTLSFSQSPVFPQPGVRFSTEGGTFTGEEPSEGEGGSGFLTGGHDEAVSLSWPPGHSNVPSLTWPPDHQQSRSSTWPANH